MTAPHEHAFVWMVDERNLLVCRCPCGQPSGLESRRPESVR